MAPLDAASGVSAHGTFLNPWPVSGRRILSSGFTLSTGIIGLVNTDRTRVHMRRIKRKEPAVTFDVDVRDGVTRHTVSEAGSISGRVLQDCDPQKVRLISRSSSELRLSEHRLEISKREVESLRAKIQELERCVKTLEDTVVVLEKDRAKLSQRIKDIVAS